MRRIIQNVGLILISTVLGLGLLEVGVRLFAPQYSPKGEIVFGVNPASGLVTGPRNRTLRQTKNTGDYDVEVSFNHHGLRDPADIADLKSGDMVVLGDSFTMGWGVPAHSRYGNQLATMTGRRVFNLAAPGDLDHYETMLTWAEGLTGSIDDIVMGLCVENDVLDYDHKQTLAQEPVAAPALTRVKRKLGRHLALYRFVTSRVHQQGGLREIAVSNGLVTPGDKPTEIALSDERIQSTLRRIEKLRQGRNVTVLIIPSRRVWIDNPGARERHRQLVEGVRQTGVEVIDPLERFNSLGLGLDALHFRYDGHWREVAHGVAAAALADHFGTVSNAGVATPISPKSGD